MVENIIEECDKCHNTHLDEDEHNGITAYYCNDCDNLMVTDKDYFDVSEYEYEAEMFNQLSQEEKRKILEETKYFFN